MNAFTQRSGYYTFRDNDINVADPDIYAWQFIYNSGNYVDYKHAIKWSDKTFNLTDIPIVFVVTPDSNIGGICPGNPGYLTNYEDGNGEFSRNSYYSAICISSYPFVSSNFFSINLNPVFMKLPLSLIYENQIYYDQISERTMIHVYSNGKEYKQYLPEIENLAYIKENMLLSVRNQTLKIIELSNKYVRIYSLLLDLYDQTVISPKILTFSIDFSDNPIPINLPLKLGMIWCQNGSNGGPTLYLKNNYNGSGYPYDFDSIDLGENTISLDKIKWYDDYNDIINIKPTDIYTSHLKIY